MKSSKRMKELSAVSSQLSATSDYNDCLWKPVSIGSYAKLRQHCVDPLTIRNELIPETLFQLGVFQANHYCAGGDCERGEQPADCEARSYAPGQHFAEVSKIDRMADPRADSGGHEALSVVSGADFRQA